MPMHIGISLARVNIAIKDVCRFAKSPAAAGVPGLCPQGNFSVEGGDITSKMLEVGIQPGKATLSQWEQIGDAMKYAKDNNIDFKLQFVK